jgi:hypothetical protein
MEIMSLYDKRTIIEKVTNVAVSAERFLANANTSTIAMLCTTRVPKRYPL